MIIYLIGYMGSGKSSIGRSLAKRMNMNFVDMDSEVVRITGRSIGEIFEADGEDTFRCMEREVLAGLSGCADTIVATGGGAPCFFDNMEVMNKTGLTIYFKMGAEKLASRLEHSKSKRPLIKDKNSEELTAYIAENLNKRETFYSKAKLIVDGDNLSDEYIAKHIAIYIRNYKK